MRTIRLRIVRGVTLPGGVNALPGDIKEVEERFGRGLLYDRRAVPADDVLDAPTIDVEPEPSPIQPQDRDPQPLTREPFRTRRGGRR